ncbi:ARM repeat-containing protein [Gonapodya prolifera JEL478]|uniref:Nucleolar protein 9 n=1 Tax=Gonapodya prolifera (strain JEL478) TaxID=1344416 RepID=A0A139B060_GONPJ|nr:ARM repeat-containing protein [Gonapodya prolifera JEL478]|eukprot:KXS22193.1 ARM repeat-containing protein [Gonapodya prolifera JEL478]
MVKHKRGRRGKKGKGVDDDGGGETEAAEVAGEGVDAVQVDSRRADAERSQGGDAAGEDQTQLQSAQMDWSHPDRRHALPLDFFGRPALDLGNYFVDIERLIRENQFEDDEARGSLIANAYASLDGNELALFADPQCSRAVECVLRLSDDWQLRVVADRVGARFYDLFRHQFASHACQTLLFLAADVMERELTGESVVNHGPDAPVVVPSMTETFLSACNTLAPHTIPLLRDRHASHPFRTLLAICAGLPLTTSSSKPTSAPSASAFPTTSSLRPAPAPVTSRNLKRRRIPPNHLASLPAEPASLSRKRAVPPSFAAILDTLVRPVCAADDAELRDLVVHQTASPGLQVAVEAGGDAGGSLAERIVDIDDGVHPAPSPYFSTLFSHPVASHLAERILRSAPYALFARVFTRDVRVSLIVMARSPVGNFVAQAAVGRAEGGELEACVDAVGKEAGSVWFAHRRPALILALSSACALRAPPTVQSAFITHLRRAFAVDVPDRLSQAAHCMIAGSPWGDWCESAARSTVDGYGCAVLAQVAGMSGDGAKAVVESILHIPPALLASLPTHASGSRLVEAVFKSTHVSRTLKRQLAGKLEAKWPDYAVDKFGSHVVEAWWNVGAWEDKDRLASLLQPHIRKLAEQHHGVMVARNLALEDRVRDLKGWTERWRGRERRKEMFKDIFTSEDAAPKQEQAAGGGGKRFFTPMFGFVALKGPDGGSAPLTNKGTKKQTDNVKGKAEKKRVEAVAIPEVDEKAVLGLLAGTSLAPKEKGTDGDKKKKKQSKEQKNGDDVEDHSKSTPAPATRAEIDFLFASPALQFTGAKRKTAADSHDLSASLLPSGPKKKKSKREKVEKELIKPESSTKIEIGDILTAPPQLPALSEKKEKKRKSDKAEEAPTNPSPAGESTGKKKKKKDKTEPEDQNGRQVKVETVVEEGSGKAKRRKKEAKSIE